MGKDDALAPKGTKDGTFAFKAFYDLLERSDTSLFPSSIIWKSCVSSKVGFFTWEATWGRIFTLYQIKK